MIGVGLAGLVAALLLSSCMMALMIPVMGAMMGGAYYLMRHQETHADAQQTMMGRMGGMMGMGPPPSLERKDLPEPESTGAKLLARYCTQCHALPSPAMHSAADWPRVAGRMMARERMMAGMRGMMMSVEAPSPQEEETLLRYLIEHALDELDPDTVPEPNSPGARLFQRVCSQCHALPDPKRHTAEEWQTVVQRMRRNMQAMGKRVITPQEQAEIIDYLAVHSS